MNFFKKLKNYVMSWYDKVIGFFLEKFDYFKSSRKDLYERLTENIDVDLEKELTLIFSIVIIFGLFVNYLFSLHFFANSYIETFVQLLFLIQLIIVIFILNSLKDVMQIKKNIYSQFRGIKIKIFKRYFIPLFLFLCIIYITNYLYNLPKNDIITTIITLTNLISFSNINLTHLLFFLYIIVLEFVILLPVIKLWIVTKESISQVINKID